MDGHLGRGYDVKRPMPRRGVEGRHARDTQPPRSQGRDPRHRSSPLVGGDHGFRCLFLDHPPQLLLIEKNECLAASANALRRSASDAAVCSSACATALASTAERFRAATADAPFDRGSLNELPNFLTN